MGSIFNLTLLLLTVYFLTGCSASNIKQDFTFSAAKNSGLLLVSVSQDKKAGTNGTVSHFYINKTGDENAFKAYKARSDNILGLGKKPSDFPDVYGVLYAVELESGQHELTRWSILTNTGASIYPKEKPPTLTFEIEPNKITYIGNLHMKLLTGENIIGMSITGGGMPVIIDKTSRDIELFNSKYPKLKNETLNVSLLKTGIWANSPEFDRHINTPILIK